MIRYIYGADIGAMPDLAQAMFRDRAYQFKDRQGWDVTVNAQGEERDEYDDLNPLYVVWQMPDGSHGGSMRLLPTTGATMINDHFGHLLGGAKISSPLIWECTRFCLGPKANPRIAAALMLAGGEVMRGHNIEQYAGVFDARMVRIYRAIGASPNILGFEGEGRDRVSVGLWSFSDLGRLRVARRAALSLDASALWFCRAFGHPEN